MKQNTFIVIPAYNEEKKIQKVIQSVTKQKYNNIVIVDDGSKDQTYERAIKQKNKKTKNIIVLKHIINRGTGAATKTGIQYAIQQKNCKYIATIDADGQHNIKDLDQALKKIQQNEKIELLLGKRQRHKLSLMPKLRNYLGQLATKFITDINMEDQHNGFIVMTKKTAQKINITTDRFEFLSELIEEIKQKKINYDYFNTKIKYTKYSRMKGQNILNGINIMLKTMMLKIK